MTINISAKAILNSLINLAGSTANLRIYNAPMPSAGASIGTCTLLAEIALGDPLGTLTSDANNYILTFNTTTPDTSANADGTAAWARITTSGEEWVADLDITATSGGGAITMPSTSIYHGGIVSLTSGTLTVPK